MSQNQRRLPTPRITTKPSNGSTSTPKLATNINNLSISSDTPSSISTIRSVNSGRSNGTTNDNSTLLTDQTAQIGSISMSRSSTTLLTNKTESFSIKSAPGDLVKQIEVKTLKF